METKRAKRLPSALVIAAFATTAALYTRLPHSFPIHWSGQGQANGYAGPPMAFLVPIVMLMINMALSAHASDAPNVATLGLSRQLLTRIRILVLALLLSLHVFVLVSAVVS
jgi:uncharacterized membrane protein